MTNRFLAAAPIVAELLSAPEVAAHWDEPSALVGMTVGGVAAHLAGQAASFRHAWTPADPDLPVVDVYEHYRRSAWRDPDDPANGLIVEGAEGGAAIGPAQLRADFDADVSWVADHLGDPMPAVARLPWWQWALPFEDFTTVRCLELVVHSDDLVASVGLPGREFGWDISGPVLTVLTRLAAERHGESAVIRHLARRERSTGSIAAL